VKPVLALVGRPNVGKSTLFNRLTKSRDALVHDLPGVTRDRHYGEGASGGRSFIAIDTGGLEPAASEGIFAEMGRQAEQAIAEADQVLFIVDGRAGLTPGDRQIAEKLRRRKPSVRVVVNKTEGMPAEAAVAEFHELGLGEPAPVSAAHGEGVRELLDAVLEKFPEERSAEKETLEKHPRVAVVGRPNVGKSTLINALVGEERVIAFDEPGTTRDAIEVPFERGGRRYTLVDTAGVRRRGRTGTPVEYFSIVKALQAIEAANVAILVLDATGGVTEQDAHVAGYILERGRAVVIAVNKWDGADKQARERMKQELAWKLGFRQGRQGPRCADALGGCRLRGGDGAPADTEAHARHDRSGRAAGAAENRPGAAEAALRAPGRRQSAAHRHPRQRARPRARFIPALPRGLLPQSVQAYRHAARHRATHWPQSLREQETIERSSRRLADRRRLLC
jgi:GTP-binding protein